MEARATEQPRRFAAGTVVIHGDAAARLGVSMKGGLVLVGGDCGYMAGFMGQKGTLVVCGNTGHAFADSMYATTCYVGGTIGALGTDAVVEPLAPEEAELLDRLLANIFRQQLRAQKPAGRDFTKVVAGRKLWNFDKHNWKALAGCALMNDPATRPLLQTSGTYSA